MGDGIGGTELNIGLFASAEECAANVAALHPAANGAAFAFGRMDGHLPHNRQCYAEYDITSVDSSHAHQRAWQLCIECEPLGQVHRGLDFGEREFIPNASEDTEARDCNSPLALAVAHYRDIVYC